MAEGLVKKRFGDQVRVYSAGSNPSGVVHPLAIEVMKEIGINIRRHKSQHWNELAEKNYDLIITVCDNADEKCPLVPSETGVRMHVPFKDPIHATGSTELRRQAFRETREQIIEHLLPVVREWLGNHQKVTS